MNSYILFAPVIISIAIIGVAGHTSPNMKMRTADMSIISGEKISLARKYEQSSEAFRISAEILVDE